MLKYCCFDCCNRILICIYFLFIWNVATGDYFGAPNISDVLYFNEANYLTIEGEKLFKVILPTEEIHGQPVIIYIKTAFQNQDEAWSSVDFVAFQGKSTEEWSLSPSLENQTTVKTLCVDCSNKSSTRKNDLVYIFVRSSEGISKIKIKITANNQKLVNLERIERNITLESPFTFLVELPAFRTNSSPVLILTLDNIIEEYKNVCMMIAVQDLKCPLKNRQDNIESAQMFSTALEKGTMIIPTSKFNFSKSLFISIFLAADDSKCHLPNWEGNTTSHLHRQKCVSVSLRLDDNNLEYYAKRILVPISVMLAVVVLGLVIFLLKLYKGDVCHSAITGHCCPPSSDDQQPDTVGSEDEIGGNEEADGIRTDYLNEIRTKFLKRNWKKPGFRERLDASFNRLNQHARFSDMAQIALKNSWFRRNRSRVYLYLVPIVCLFYFVPAIQYSFLAKQHEQMLGNEDLCFHNFRCSKSFWIFADFNHTISNLSYVISGLMFILIVHIKAKWLQNRPARVEPAQTTTNNKISLSNVESNITRPMDNSFNSNGNNTTDQPVSIITQNRPHNVENGPITQQDIREIDSLKKLGIFQQLGIYYAMGLALVFQGGFSICYHVCPTNLTLQFDTTLMYLICILGLVKIYQFRHPDASPNAYAVFGFVGVLVLFEAVALHKPNWWTYGIFLAFYLVTVICVAFDGYYVGLGRMNRELARELSVHSIISTLTCNCIHVHSTSRLVRGVFLFICNLAVASFLIYQKINNPAKNISNSILFILGANLIIYLLIFVVCKNLSNYTRKKRSIYRRLFSTGALFSVCAILLGILAFIFYRQKNANRNMSPAESRNLNDECIWMDFYDAHDLWHFFSAAAAFMAFLGLLTVDDDLLDMPIHKIRVY